MACEHIWKDVNFTSSGQNTVGDDDIISTVLHKKGVKHGSNFYLDFKDLGQIHFNRGKISVPDMQMDLKEVEYNGSVSALLKIKVATGMKTLNWK